MSASQTPSKMCMPSNVYSSAQRGASFTRQIYTAAIQGKHTAAPYELATPDGVVRKSERVSRHEMLVDVSIKNIPAVFRGLMGVAPVFVLKSSITQLAVDAVDAVVELDKANFSAIVHCKLVAVAPLGQLTLDYIGEGSIVGKLFAPDTTRQVTSVDVIKRLYEKIDARGMPLFYYGSNPGGDNSPSATPTFSFDMKMVDGRVVAMIPVRPGKFTYDGEVHGLLPTVGKALKSGKQYKDLLRLHQQHLANGTRVGQPDHILMVRSYDFHMRTLFGRVATDLLPKGLTCMSSTIVEPHSKESTEVRDGRTFVFRGESAEELTHIPLEFFCTEPFRDGVKLEQRGTLVKRLHDPASVKKIVGTMPDNGLPCCIFVCKGSLFDDVTAADWVVRDPKKEMFPGVVDPKRQHELAEAYLYQQAEYHVLSAIQNNDITSDGVLITRYFPSPVLKSLLLSRIVSQRVRAVVFLKGSREYGNFFSQEDRAMLIDLTKFGISVLHFDAVEGELYEFQVRPNSDSGLLVPMSRRDEYLTSSVFGVYGSNLVAGDFESELRQLMAGVLDIRKTSTHALLNKDKPMSLVTGGGPGAMEVGNRVAKQLGILSIGMFVDFGAVAKKKGATINEQKKNPFVEAFMTYRPEKLVERQSEFNLDFPIFLTGGIGTDFEYALEEVRRKVGVAEIHPMILFGSAEHWGNKITGRFQENLRSGTIKGSEWLSTIPYVVSNWKEALAVYKKFFSNTLAIGPGHPMQEKGFVLVDDAFVQSAFQ